MASRRLGLIKIQPMHLKNQVIEAWMVKPLSGGYVNTMVTASVEMTPSGDQKQEIKFVKIFLNDVCPPTSYL